MPLEQYGGSASVIVYLKTGYLSTPEIRIGGVKMKKLALMGELFSLFEKIDFSFFVAFKLDLQRCFYVLHIRIFVSTD